MNIEKPNWTWLLSQVYFFAWKIVSWAFLWKYNFILRNVDVFERLKKGGFVVCIWRFIFWLGLSFWDEIGYFLQVLQSIEDIDFIFLGEVIRFSNLLFGEPHLLIHCHINSIHLSFYLSIITKNVYKNFWGWNLWY